jgi:CMD domain protein
MTDIIDHLAGISAGSPLDKARDNRREARKYAQASYDALFVPRSFGTFGAVERYAIAAFVAGLHGRSETADFYKSKLAESGGSAELRVAIASEIFEAHTHGPYGHFPKGPLTLENSDGKLYAVGPQVTDLIGRRLAAALEHVHMLVYHPRDAAAPSLQAMLDAGWSTTDVVTLSQLVSFLAFQIRVVAGLKALAAGPK